MSVQPLPPAAPDRPGALTRPRRLVPGDTVAVVAPSGPSMPERLAAGVALLESWGLRVRVMPHVLTGHQQLPHLAATDAERAADLQQAWLDPEVAAVICARGGYGAQRMVELLDWDALRAAPAKVFLGYSDATALHEAFALRLGLATLYGPMAAGQVFTEDAATAEHLRRTLFEPERVRLLGSPSAECLVPGRARGVTAGGCLTLLATDRGTPAARPDFAGAILVLEDVGEPLYSLDRLLTQLLRSGALAGVAGVALGSWEGCHPAYRINELMLDRLGPLGVPVVGELGFGHGPSSITVPLGLPAVLDADAGTLELELPALGG